jgi:methylenetetrahydrofolate dehydrogenase (NADP+)/methenyltetrahydrofolate cyclohydrolase
MAVLIKGKETSEKIIEKIKNEVEKLDKKPALAVIIVGDNPASQIYVKKKNETAKRAGMDSIVIEMGYTVSQEELLNKINELNNNGNINGILIQLPLPAHINTYEVIEKIKPEKDVDGFHPVNVGRLAIGLEPFAVSCTPAGIIELLDDNGIKIEGKNVVIIGRSNIVGKPLSYLFLNRNATVTVCHSKTVNLPEIASTGDILVAAVGIAGFVKAEWVKKDAIVIDVGINRTEDNKLKGDVDFEEVEPKTSYITPVPGGVGPMTIAMLLSNTLNLYKIQNKCKNQMR